jgi:hypothetical protein
MGTQGIVYKDLGVDESEQSAAQPPKSSSWRDILPVPGTDPRVHEGTATTLRDAPTDSHALAMDASKTMHPAEKGLAQVEHDQEVVDLGWNEPKEAVAKPLVGGLSNEDLWLLVRRFNKASGREIISGMPALTSHSKCTMSRR